MKRIVKKIASLTIMLAMMATAVCGGIRIQGVTADVKNAKAAERDNWGCDFSRGDFFSYKQQGVRDVEKGWYDNHKKENEFHITTCAEFNYLAELVNDGTTFEGKTVYLDNNLVVGDVAITPRVGEYKNRFLRKDVKHAFKGTFDGQKNWIHYISTTDTRDGAGVFGYTKNATIKNLGVLAELEGESRVGTIIGWMEGGTISNCIAHANIHMITENDIGGIVGRCEGGTIDHCTFTELGLDDTPLNGRSGIQANTLFQKSSIGGIAGYCTEGSTVRYCVCTDIEIKADHDHVGGIVGHSKGTVEYCRSDVKIKEDGKPSNSSNIDDAGGIVGKNEGTVKGCISKVDAKVDGGNVGGVVGLNEGSIEDCYAEGSLKGDEDIGGVCGDNKEKGRINRCYAKVSVKGDCRAGLVGCNKGRVDDSFAMAGVAGTDTVVGDEKTGRFMNCSYLNSDVFDTFDEDVMLSGGYPFNTKKETKEVTNVSDEKPDESIPTEANDESEKVVETTGSVFGGPGMIWIILLVVVVVGVGAGTAIFIRKRNKTE